MTLGVAITVICLLAGGFFGLVGSIGLLRLPTPMMRLHAPTKATTLGVGGVLVAAILRGWKWETFPVAAVLILLFLLATAPVVAMMLARIRLQEDGDDLPPPRDGAQWSVREGAASPPDS